MAHVIRASSWFTKRYLKVTDRGVEFMETAALGGKNKFAFSQIDCVLMSPSNLLSFQVGVQVFSIQIKPHKAKHNAAVAALVQGVSQRQSSGGFPVAPVWPGRSS